MPWTYERSGSGFQSFRSSIDSVAAGQSSDWFPLDGRPYTCILYPNGSGRFEFTYDPMERVNAGTARPVPWVHGDVAANTEISLSHVIPTAARVVAVSGTVSGTIAY